MSTSVARHHTEWLSLIEVSGPFLTVPVLQRALPQGLEPIEADLAAEVRRAHDEWRDDPGLHGQWIRWVLTSLLGFGDETLKEGPAVPATLTYAAAEHGETLRPDLAVCEPRDDGKVVPRLLVAVWPEDVRLDERLGDRRWSATPLERMTDLVRATGVRLGLVTNGERWTLVHAPASGPTAYASWDADLWLEERSTLDAFATVLGARRFFGVPASDTLEALLDESANAEQEVTDQLGRQVRQAVELLVDAFGRADREHGRTLLGRIGEEDLRVAGVDRAEQLVYLAAVTVMMRLVFLLSAEERGLFLLGDPLYDSSYAVSTLRAQLQEEADRFGEEPLERRSSAWHRILGTFRMVHAGVQHEDLRLPAYGGSLFDPDRFPFLEGRAPGDQWRDTPGRPLPVDDRTVLHILDALQVLRFRVGRGVSEARRLSFRALDVEQIGHVYEGLLDHMAVQVSDPAVGLNGKLEPEVALAELEERARGDRRAFVDWLAEITGRTAKAIEKALDESIEPHRKAQLLAACDNDQDLAERVAPYHGLLRDDLRGLPQVYVADSVYVTKAGERRTSGTYYTPRSLAEEMVEHALAPLVYQPGPAEGADPGDWKLKSPTQLLELKVCDMAMGSGAFLVAATRYLADRLVEAWAEAGTGPITIEGKPAATPAEAIPADPDDQVVLARRLVADRCIYGVEKNPMAVEMAKLSMWLITLAKDRPFSFLDHALKPGDSLLGIHDLAQIEHLHMDPERGRELHTTLEEPWHAWQAAVKEAIERRRELESFTVLTVRDAELKERLFREAEAALDDLKVAGDVIVGAALSTARKGKDKLDSRLLGVAGDVAAALDSTRRDADRRVRLQNLRTDALYWLNDGKPPMQPDRRPFHWPIEFPEVFMDRGGFDAVVGNPPYIGNKYWKERLGDDFQPYFASLLRRALGKPDVVVLFVWRMVQLLRDGGIASSLATQSITEVDSKNLMQAIVMDRATIVRAFRARPWPGDAAVFVSVLWLRKGRWDGAFVLDGAPVPGIDADLRESFGKEPAELTGCLFAFQGVDNSRGMAFVVPADDPLCEHPDLFKPYVSGEDLTQQDPTRPTRFVLDLTGWSEADLGKLPADVRRLLYDVVRPTRTDEQLKSYKGLSKRWWTFWNTREDGYRVVRTQEHCIVVPAVAKHLIALRLPSQWVYTNMVVVFDISRPDVQTLLLSPCFDLWAKKYGGSLGEGRRMKIGPVVRTFPLPTGHADVELGEGWQEAALASLHGFGPGLNDVVSRVHDPSCDSEQIARLRSWYEQIHGSVVEAYGWSDLASAFAFEATDEGVRWSLPPETQSELLRRLHELNRTRQRDRNAAGPGTKRRRGRGRQTSATAHPTFEGMS